MGEDPVAAVFQITKVQTMADGGIRVTLDGPEDIVVKAAVLMEWKRLGYPVKATFERHGNEPETQANGRKLHI